MDAFGGAWCLVRARLFSVLMLFASQRREEKSPNPELRTTSIPRSVPVALGQPFKGGKMNVVGTGQSAVITQFSFLWTGWSDKSATSVARLA